jgi:hypothetical protein
MRYGLFLSIFLGMAVWATAQNTKTASPTLKTGYSLSLSYNLYSWHRAPQLPDNPKPPPYSTGQALNILPGLGAGLWLGTVDKWLLSLESELTFLPFALDVQHYRGLGVLEVPTLIKFQFPLSRQQSLWTFLHIGAGLQWQLLDLYDRALLPTQQRKYWTYVGEIGWHLSAVAHQRHRIRELVYFVRFGFNQQAAINVQTGLQVYFRNGNR